MCFLKEFHLFSQRAKSPFSSQVGFPEDVSIGFAKALAKIFPMFPSIPNNCALVTKSADDAVFGNQNFGKKSCHVLLPWYETPPHSSRFSSRISLFPCLFQPSSFMSPFLRKFHSLVFCRYFGKLWYAYVPSQRALTTAGIEINVDVCLVYDGKNLTRPGVQRHRETIQMKFTPPCFQGRSKGGQTLIPIYMYNISVPNLTAKNIQCYLHHKYF